MLPRCIPFALLLAGVALVAPLAGQPPLPPKPPVPGPQGDPFAALQKLTGAKAAEIEQAVRGVAVYPPRTRAAILDLANYAQKHPTLLGELAKLRSGPAEAIDRYLTGNKFEPELQQAAALVLVEAPETVARMQEHPELVRVVGVAWSTPPGRQLITAVLEAAAARQEKTRNASADRWAGRLKADPALMQQYTQLLEDYTRKTAAAAGQQPDESWQSYGYGTYKTKDGYVVDDVPSPDVINYALAVGPQYKNVAIALIQQYLTGQNQDDYNAAVGGWYSANGDSIPQSSRQDNSDYYDLLQELAALAQAASASGYGSGDGSGSGNNSGNNSGNTGTNSGNNSGDGSGNVGDGNTINNFLGANPRNYPKLADWAKKNPAPKLASPAELTRLKDGPGSGKPPFDPGKNPAKTPGAAPFSERMRATPPGDRARPMPQGAKNPFALAGKAPGGAPKPAGGGPQQIFRGSPSMGHQLSRAPGQMHAAWQPRGGGGARPGGPKK